MGHEKGINASEITLCLLYDYARTGNQQALNAARRIAERRKREARAKDQGPGVKGEGLGLLGDICIGILGAILGDFGARFLGIVTYSTLGRLVLSVVGAVLLLMVLSALFGKRGKS